MVRYRAAKLACVAALLLFACGALQAQPAPDKSAATQNTAKLTAVLMALPIGTPWLYIRTGLTCLLDNEIQRAPGGRTPQNLPPFAAAFGKELEGAGFKAVADDDLFHQDEGAADYQVGAVVTDAHVVACVSRGGLLSAGSAGDAKGSSSMKVDWQIYSPLKKEVVARVSTSAEIELDKTVPDGMTQLIVGAFASNARELVANAAFRDAMSAKRLNPDEVIPAEKQSRIALLGSQKAAKRPIADAVGGVVTLLTGNGSGSGVLISQDGYILTNAHVVGSEKEIRVRWSDGIDSVAQIIRVAKLRDVALVKTNPRERQPLAIARGPVNPGQHVYAIGSPGGAVFAGTVSSGVLSANRIMDGLRFIQSDVSVSPGSSGGALLDETGSLLGITVAGVDNGGRAGLNLFIPIGDAMDFLNLEQN